ncbi:Beta-1,4-galactosyltransferase 4 [Bulinus truncatus]|nr:Beta-1,4-galactosyltransferase 4 [Bulinus truncatus]
MNKSLVITMGSLLRQKGGIRCLRPGRATAHHSPGKVMVLQVKGRLRRMFAVVCLVAIAACSSLAVWSNLHTERKLVTFRLHNPSEQVPIETSNSQPTEDERTSGIFLLTGEINNELSLEKNQAMPQNTSESDNTGEVATEDITKKTMELCPFKRSELRGPLMCRCNETTPEKILEENPGVIKDGHIQASDCISQERVAIIIPYRDRYQHLHQLLSMLVPVLNRQKVDATIFVIEQVKPFLFNRGALHNVGFLESEKVGKFDCYIFHDVDLVPINDKNIYTCADNPVHFSVSIKYNGSHDFGTMYEANFGGIVAFTRDQYLAVNGNSNLYFGWGGEDDELYQRVKFHQMKRIRNSPLVARYIMLGHAKQNVVNGNPARLAILKTAKRRHTIDGLNTVQYTVHGDVKHPLYRWINVTLNMDDMFQSAPIFLSNYLNTVTQFQEKKLKESQKIAPTSKNKPRR